MNFNLKIDFTLLSHQKDWLQSQLQTTAAPLVEGLLNLIDNIQDQAHEQGAPNVYTYDND